VEKPKVFVTRLIPDEGLEQVEAFCQADVWQEELPPSREVLLERVQGVDGLLSLLTDPVDGALMEVAGPGLKVISNYAVGYDNIDVAAATGRGIPVGNTPGSWPRRAGWWRETSLCGPAGGRPGGRACYWAGM
jgi:glyoxylate reductase